jgi:branched-chain amino acid transport system substrate-binding protein
MDTPSLNRRAFMMLGSAAIASVAGLTGCSKSPAASRGSGDGAQSGAGGGDTVTVVGLSEYTGIYAELGSEIKQAIDLLRDEYGGKVGKYKLNFAVRETQAKTDEAVRQVKEAISAGQILFMGTQLSNIALAISGEVNKLGGVFCTLAGAAEITGSACKKSTFRWSDNTWTAGQEVVAAVMADKPDLKNWFCITPDYVFGKALLDSTTDAVKNAGGQVVGNAYHATQETEFSSYLNNAAASKADVLAILNVGAQTINTVKQAIQFGLHKKMQIVIVWSTGLTQFRAIGADNVEGIYAGAQYWHGVDTPNNKKLVEAVQKKFNINPSYGLAAAYYQAKSMLVGVENAGSSKAADIIKAMETKPFAGTNGDEVFRPEDHQLLKDYYVLRGKARAEQKDADDLMSVVAKGHKTMPASETGCHMAPLGG